MKYHKEKLIENRNETRYLYYIFEFINYSEKCFSEALKIKLNYKLNVRKSNF